jgi:hypothetical protein
VADTGKVQAAQEVADPGDVFGHNALGQLDPISGGEVALEPVEATTLVGGLDLAEVAARQVVLQLVREVKGDFRDRHKPSE